jgi:AcrR family transcriptional regulator
MPAKPLQAPAVSSAPERPARQRILATARALFYAEGVHAVGIDRIIAEAGVAKATFYRHFPAKDDLVCAYLQEQSLTERTTAERIRGDAAPPLAKILELFQVIGDVGCRPGFRGCPFINAAAEYPDHGHQVQEVIAGHRRWFRTLLADLVSASGHPNPRRAAAMLAVVRDSLVVGSELDDPAEMRELARCAVERVLEATSRNPQ